jgi:ABC-type molybdenum transport system ATPase subunit/photorepair protein PhrA
MIKGTQEQQSIINEQHQINELKQMVQILSANETSSERSSALNISGSYLQQIIPNPFSQNTVIRCVLSSSARQAQLIIYTADGKALKSYSLNNSGMNEITINAGTLSSGQYKYALIVDGKQVDSKTMIVTK